MRLARTAMMAAMVLLGACGGGSGGSGGSGGGGGGQLTLSTSSLNFSANSLSTPPPTQTISATVSGQVSGTLFIRIVVTGNAVSNVSNVQVTGSNSGQAQVMAAAPGSVGIGTHNSTITVTACTTDINCTSGLIGTPQTISVTYVVNAVSATPTSLGFVTQDTSPDSDFVKTLQLTASPPWTANSSLSALTVTPSSGNATNATLTASLSRTAVNAMPPGTSSAQITITGAGGLQQIIPVTINIRRASIKYAAPRVVPANQAGVTYISGTDLDTVGVSSVQFGTGASAVVVPASSLTVEPSRIVISNRPALPAGSYPIRFTSSAGTVYTSPTASLLVVNNLALPAQTLPYPDARNRHVTDLQFDMERQAMVVGVRYDSGESDTETLRYTYSGTSWSAGSVLPAPFRTSLALKPDGSGWLATRLVNAGSSNSMQACTPDLTTCTDSLLASAASSRWTRIGMTFDGIPLVLTDSRPVSGAAANVARFAIDSSSLSSIAPKETYDGLLAASDDGNAVAIGSRGTASGIVQQLHVFRASSNSFLSTTVGQPITRLEIDGRGTRVIVNGSQVYDPNTFTQQASLPATSLYAVLSRDGTRAYTYDSNGTIRIFNLSTALFTGQYPEIGSGITPAGDPGAGPNGQDMRMALSPDGRTLFLAGSLRVVVQPLP